MTDSRRDVAVVGAGVIGLTPAVQLAEAGWNVHVLTKDLPMHTTLSAAGSMWAAPYLVEPRDRVHACAVHSLAPLLTWPRYLAQVSGSPAVPRPRGQSLSLDPPIHATFDDPNLVSRADLVPVMALALTTRVGLRPTRPAIRCEANTSVTRYRLLHNYGHGGGGVSVSWGCASEIAKLAETNQKAAYRTRWSAAVRCGMQDGAIRGPRVGHRYVFMSRSGP